LQPEPVASLGKPAEIHIDRSARLLPHSTDPQVAEYYRSLRTKLVQAREFKLFRTLAVTSPNPREGKTVTVLNLALSFAMLPSFKVLVIDGDLRKGSLGKWLGADRYLGLGNYLEGNATLEQVVLRNDQFPVHFVVRGNAKTPPGELLHGPKWKKFVHRMGEHYDLILVDCPPVNIVTDTQLLAAGCDGVLLVARAFTTTCTAFQKAVADLSSFRIIGTVLNQATGMLMQRGYGVYGRYAKS
jgi:capsular exopolysaccharide synthesis family protein